jgi:hypothetical protein
VDSKTFQTGLNERAYFVDGNESQATRAQKWLVVSTVRRFLGYHCVRDGLMFSDDDAPGGSKGESVER